MICSDSQTTRQWRQLHKLSFTRKSTRKSSNY